MFCIKGRRSGSFAQEIIKTARAKQNVKKRTNSICFDCSFEMEIFINFKLLY
jgi:hypothetical protein